MRRCFQIIALLLFLCPGALIVHGQDRPIGYWRSHLNYNNVYGVATDGNILYAIAQQAFFSYNAVNGEMTAYSKVDGMSDIGMAGVGYDAATNTVVLAYNNSNVDLFKDNSFYNIPDIKNYPFSGSKAVNNIYTQNGFAYLSTGLGVVVLDLDKRQSRETYVFNKNNQIIAVNSFTGDDIYFYAATNKGLYRARQDNPNLQAFSVWTALDTAHVFTGLATVQQKIFVAGTDSLFVVDGSGVKFLQSMNQGIDHLDGGKNMLNISTFYGSNASGVYRMDMNYTITDTFKVGYAHQAVETADGTLWAADQYDGLTKRLNGNDKQLYVPSGPFTYTAFDIIPYNKDVWVAHGGYNDNFALTGNRFGVSHLKNETWTNYRQSNTSYLDNITDIVDLCKAADGTIYCGSMQDGMAVILPDGSGYAIKKDTLQSKINEPDVYPATSSEIDQNGALWITQNNVNNELAVRSKEGNWYHYTTPVSFGGGFTHGAAGLILDDNNQKWYFGPQGRGVLVYNDNNTVETGDDDTYRQFKKGAGAGNLPSDKVYCLAKDKDGAIWVGTDAGIAIINCGYNAIQSACDAELRVVQYDQFAGFLFSEEQVKTIAVDGGNRKWIGTTHGVWLITPDANKEILRFTTKNSPLPSDVIQKIAIDPVTGDVYIGTDQGMMSYRGTSVEGGTTNSDLITFPNPVPSGYTGPIAIKGLVTDADVRITDIAGQLVYRTKAQGGQATWNGLDYTGKRPQSGVFLIFVTNKDGSQTKVGKMIFNH